MMMCTAHFGAVTSGGESLAPWESGPRRRCCPIGNVWFKRGCGPRRGYGTCKNITFPHLRLRESKIMYFRHICLLSSFVSNCKSFTFACIDCIHIAFINVIKTPWKKGTCVCETLHVNWQVFVAVWWKYLLNCDFFVTLYFLSHCR